MVKSTWVFTVRTNYHTDCKYMSCLSFQVSSDSKSTGMLACFCGAVVVMVMRQSVPIRTTPSVLRFNVNIRVYHAIYLCQVELKDGKRIETDLHERRPVADTEQVRIWFLCVFMLQRVHYEEELFDLLLQTLDPVYLGLNLITLGAPFVPPTAAARQMRPQAIQHVNPFNQNGIMNTLQRAWADFELHGDVFMADVSDEPSDDDDDDAGVIYLGNGDDEVNVRVIFEDDNASRRRRQPTAAPAPARRTRRMAPDTTDRENLEHSRTHRRRTILHDNDEHVQHVARHTPPRPHRAAQPTLPRVFTGPLPDSVRRLMPHLEQRFTVPDEAPNRTRRTGRRRTP